MSRLEITRETVTGDPGGAGTDEPAAADPVPARSRPADGSPIGVVTVPAWRPGLAQSALPSSYGTCWRCWPMRGGRCGPGALPPRPG
jgi:hypothetical protein